ncbi:class I SAM-dependent methyltransferase [Sinomicrobium sp. M5D2P17]
MSLLLKKSPFQDVSMQDIANQLESRKKAEKKLPLWFRTPGIYYPPKLSIEQTSSETTAAYKADLVYGKTLIDLTGGFGVDCRFFAEKFDRVIHCEMNPELSEIASHNFEVLGIKNITTVSGDGIGYLQKNAMQFDWIYADPSRRNDAKGKVFMLADCLPDIPAHLDQLFARSENILIKTSPILDITNGLQELRFVKEVHVVAVNNEVKELLWIMQKGFSGNCILKTVNITGGDEKRFDFTKDEESHAEVSYSLPLRYLYEPNAAILKSGGFKSLSEKTGLGKLHRHSHLYTSEELYPDFPGRSFRITGLYTYNNKKTLKKMLSNSQANITTRNFPESVAQIRKKFGIKDGGNRYIFFTTNRNDEKIAIVCFKTG